jgi:multisubunit Na+/H+ antiporter MnhC subunit
MNDLLHPIFSAFRREKWLAEADSIRMIFLTASIAAGVYYYLQCVALFVAIHRHRIIKRIRGMRIALMAVNLAIPTSAVFQNCPVWGPTASVVGAFAIDTDSGFRPMDKSITPNAKGYFFSIGIGRNTNDIHACLLITAITLQRNFQLSQHVVNPFEDSQGAQLNSILSCVPLPIVCSSRTSFILLTEPTNPGLLYSGTSSSWFKPAA